LVYPLKKEKEKGRKALIVTFVSQSETRKAAIRIFKLNEEKVLSLLPVKNNVFK